MMRSLALTIFCGVIVVKSAVIDISKDKNGFLPSSVQDALNDDVTSVFNEVSGNDSVNYSIEMHSIETDDGYILTMHRIINKASITKKKGIPVFLQHSYLSSSMDWLILGPKRALGFLLADAGYDVWLGNFRGNKYSSGHVHYNHSDSKYWDFSFHEMGMFDIPSMIDYIMLKSSYNKLYYIGHGQAVTAFLVMTSMKPAYNDKVARMFALGPIAFCDTMFSPMFQGIARVEKKNKTFLHEIIGKDEFHPSNRLLYQFADYICNSTKTYINGPLCFNFMALLNGFKGDNIDQKTLNLILRYPSLGGGSAKQIEHYAQLYNSGIFQQFNNGPQYNLTKVTTPVTIFFGDNDWISSIKDFYNLRKKLQDVDYIIMDDKYFYHVDFLWGKQAKKFVYEPLMDIMKFDSAVISN